MSERAALGIAVLAAALLGLCHAQLKDGCKKETLRACGEDYIPYAKTPHLEYSGSLFEKECEMFKEQIACSIKFSKNCLEGLSKAATLLPLEAFEENIDVICTNGSKQYADFQKSVRCLNSVGTKINGCLKALRESMRTSVAKAPPKEIVPYVCCPYGDLLDCLDPVLEHCENDGGKEFITGTLEQVFGDSLSLVCGNNRRGSETCKALPKLTSLDPKDIDTGSFMELLIEASNAFTRKN